MCRVDTELGQVIELQYELITRVDDEIKECLKELTEEERKDVWRLTLQLFD